MNGRSCVISGWLATLLTGPLLGAGGVAAQSPARDTLPSPDTVVAVAPVRVTVLRTPMAGARVPYAVTVEEPPRDVAGLSAAALVSAPGVQIDSRYNFAQGDRISVRGLGARTQFGVRGVKVLVDGVPATMPDGQTALSVLDPWAVTRAEVLRGPASSLWGNAAGGVIRLETGPVAGSEARVAAGSHGLLHARASAAAAVGERGPAVSASVGRLEYDGFREHAAARKWFGGARGRWLGARDELTVVLRGVDYRADNPGSLSEAQLAADRWQAHPFNVTQGTGEAASQAQVGVTWRRGPGRAPGGSTVATPAAGPVLEVTGWALGRTLDNPIPPAVIDLGRRAAGLRVTAHGTARALGRAVDWAAGLDAEGQWDDRRTFENDAGRAGAPVLDQAETVAALAPFVQASARLVGPVRALAGLRWDAFRFSARDRRTVDDPDDSGVRTMARPSPSAGLVADLGEGGLFLGVASSFETPTTTELVNRPDGAGGLNPSLEPQRALSVEAGARVRRGGRLAAQLSVYRIGVEDALLPFEVPGAPGRSFFRNAGRATHRGVEADLWWAPARGVHIRAAYAWTDARFDDFATDTGDHAGNRVPGVAPHRVQATLTWDPGPATLALEQRWMAAVPVDDANTAEAPAYGLMAIRGSVEAVRAGALEIELFGGIENVLDQDHITAVVVNAFGGRYYEPGPRRSVHLGLRVTPAAGPGGDR